MRVKRSTLIALVFAIVASNAVGLVNAPPGQAGAGDGTLNVRVVRDVNGKFQRTEERSPDTRWGRPRLSNSFSPPEAPTCS